MTQLAGGILAAWNDCAPEGLAEYEHWYAHHLAERVGVPGFREGRRYEAVPGEGGDRQFFTFYPVDNVGVLSSPVYLARLENPHPDTLKAMRHFRNMMRTVCVNVQEDGDIAGSYAVTLRFNPQTPVPMFDSAFAKNLRAELDALHVRLWVAAPAQTGSTVEARARGVADARLGFAVIVECSRLAEARDMRAKLGSAALRRRFGLPDGGMLGIYGLLCILRAGDIS